jgi:hypothetical protein
MTFIIPTTEQKRQRLAPHLPGTGSTRSTLSWPKSGSRSFALACGCPEPSLRRRPCGKLIKKWPGQAELLKIFQIKGFYLIKAKYYIYAN